MENKFSIKNILENYMTSGVTIPVILSHIDDESVKMDISKCLKKHPNGWLRRENTGDLSEVYLSTYTSFSNISIFCYILQEYIKAEKMLIEDFFYDTQKRYEGIGYLFQIESWMDYMKKIINEEDYKVIEKARSRAMIKYFYKYKKTTKNVNEFSKEKKEDYEKFIYQIEQIFQPYMLKNRELPLFTNLSEINIIYSPVNELVAMDLYKNRTEISKKIREGLIKIYAIPYFLTKRDLTYKKIPFWNFYKKNKYKNTFISNLDIFDNDKDISYGVAEICMHYIHSVIGLESEYGIAYFPQYPSCVLTGERKFI
jgi:hypothetical protein